MSNARQIKPTPVSGPQRTALTNLFTTKFRNDPAVSMMIPLVNEATVAKEIMESLEGTQEMADARRALAALSRLCLSMHGIGTVVVHGDGYAKMQSDSRGNHGETIALQVKQRNREITRQNEENAEARQAAHEEWKKDRADKMIALQTSRSLEELLYVVPELRVGLPSKRDLELNAAWVPGQISERSMTRAEDILIDVEAN
jgi:hypothetical protein